MYVYMYVYIYIYATWPLPTFLVDSPLFQSPFSTSCLRKNSSGEGTPKPYPGTGGEISGAAAVFFQRMWLKDA